MNNSFPHIYDLLSRPYSLLITAFVLDLCIGDPVWLTHPVRIMGWIIVRIEHISRIIINHFPANRRLLERLAGVFLTLFMVSFTYGVFYTINLILLNSNLRSFMYYIGLIVIIYLISATIAVKGLIDSARLVIESVREKNVAGARIELSHIVGRDTGQLDERGIIKAVIETLAENASDGIIAPIFYFAIGGLPLAMTYKAINTMDSMVGYKNERYRDFGWAAARLDDAANYIPARITGALIPASSAIVCRSLPAFVNSLKVMLRDGRKHLSPNSGVPEAAMAGALGLSLGGPSMYGGRVVEKPYLGSNPNLNELDGVSYLYASEKAVSIVRLTSIIVLNLAALAIYLKT